MKTYPLPAGQRFEDMQFVPVWIHDLRGSDFWAQKPPEVCYFALNLWLESFLQDPMGTLPQDDRLLFTLSGYARRGRFDAFLRRKPEILEKWEPMEVHTEAGPTVRLGHPYITRRVLELLHRRRAQRIARAALDRRRRESEQTE